MLCEIKPPILVNQRGHYKLSEADLKRANEMHLGNEAKVRIFVPKGLNKD